MKLITKVLSIVIVATALASVTSTQITKREVENLGQEDLVLKCQAILDQLEGVRDYVADQGGLDEYMQQMVAKFPDGELSKESRTNVLKRVPIFAAMKVGQDQSTRGGYTFRVFSPEPGIAQIGRAVHDLDKVTQNNAASSEEAAAASVELTRQSEQLDELVGDVGTVLNGNKKAV